jgi:ribonucleoside-diphosphate reductase alpha chain
MINIKYIKEKIPVYDITVEDNHNFYANDILVHNCTEVILPSRPSKSIHEELVQMENGEKRIIKRYECGEISLCNLSSVNLERWFYMNDGERKALINTIVRALDNTIDIASYPVKEAKNSNLMYRYLGIGVLNYANYLALKEIIIDSREAAEETDKLFDELSYLIISASVDLAIEKGKFPKFYETKWSKGILPIHKANEKANLLTNYCTNWDKWNELSERVKMFGIRNAQLMAIAPTMTSGRCVNSTESTEPIHNFYYKKEGTITLPTIVPNFRKNNAFYKRAFDCDQYALLRNAAVRQKWIDQAQSINVYITKPDSLKEMSDLHLYGFSIGLKTFYYLRQEKEIDKHICESCS